MAPHELRQRRIQLGLTQTELSRMLGVNANTWAKWERGDQPMRFPRMIRLALDHLATEKNGCRSDPVCWQRRQARWTAPETGQ